MIKLLVMEGNTRERQRAAADMGVRTASGIYVDAISALFPEVETDVLNGTQGKCGLPPGASLSDYDGLVVGGSGLRCADVSTDVTSQIDLLRQYSKLGRPILGSCWGLQIAVVAAGGTVRPSPNGREIILARKLTLTEMGKQHAFFANKPIVFDAPCTHFDEIETLPSDATLLCSNSHSEVQAAVVPLENAEVWGVQYHPEFDTQHLADLLKLYGDSTIEDGFFADDATKELYRSQLELLAANPHDQGLAWQLGFDQDILDVEIRSAEISNWIRHAVMH